MKQAILYISILVLTIGCNTKGNQNKVDKNRVEQSAEIDEFKAKIKTIRPQIRDVEDMSLMLSLSGVDFIPGLINDPQKWESYSAHDAISAANMGIYLIDGYYQAAYNEKRNGYMSFMAAKSLAQQIGVLSIFDELLIKRLNEGVIPEDSVFDKFNDALYSSEKVMKDQESMRLFSALLVGTYVEKQYLLFNSVFNIPDDLPEEVRLNLASKLIVVASEELQQLPVLLSVLDEYRTERDSGVLVDELKELDSLRESLNLSKKLETVAPATIYDNPTLKQMHDRIVKMRSFLVN